MRPRSLRLRALLVSLAVAFVPPLVVVLAHPLETGLQGRMERRVVDAAHAAAAGHDLHVLAVKFGVRLRVVDADGAVQFDEDRDSRSWVSRLSTAILAEPGAPTVDDVERTLPPIRERTEVTTPGQAICRAASGSKLLLCAAAADGADGSVVYATHSSRRAMGALYDVRYQLVKLSLLTASLALVLGLYLGWRMVRPVEELTRQVTKGRAIRALDRNDEMGDLSLAFATLTQALVERSQQNEKFVADLAHEMKNPIAAIRAASDVVDDGSERGARLARVLGDASRRLDALVVSLLELARAEAGIAPHELVDVAAVVAGVVEARPDHAKIALTTASPAYVRGSARHLESVVRNLLDNAVAFGAHVRVHVTGDRERVTLTVDDDGPGIAPDVLPRVFERFFTTRGERQGTGLGLALVKAVVEAHDGTVSADSVDGAGARFTVTLPAVSQSFHTMRA